MDGQGADATDGPCRRAWDLLREHLTPEQRAELDAHGYFHTVGAFSGLRYQIRGTGTRSQNITAFDEQGRTIATLCFGPQGTIPLGDHMLAQKIVLENPILEPQALKIARVRRQGGWS
jgi:hypothetical protein